MALAIESPVGPSPSLDSSGGGILTRVILRVASNYASIDTRGPEFDAETDFIRFDQPEEGLDGGYSLISNRALSLSPVRSFLVNCPIQREAGSL